MPLPFLIPIALGLAGAFGVGKTVKAVIDNSDAKDIRKEATSIASDANEKMEKSKENTNKLLSDFGRKKLDVIQTTLSDFVDIYQKIAAIKPLKFEGFNEILGKNRTPNDLINDLRKSCDVASEIAMGLSSGIAGGALTAMAAYGGTMALAAAGTGTAISSLTGAAATNATLAWLGGGTLASGGLGIAGGTMVLGLLVAGPALAIFGTIFGSKASKNLDDAYSARYEARTYAEKIKTITQKLEMIDKVTNLGVTVLTIMNQRLKESISPISNMLNRLGNEIKFSDDIDKLLFVAVKFAQVVKTIIDTPIMSKDGDLLPEAETSFKEIQNNTELIGN